MTQPTLRLGGRESDENDNHTTLADIDWMVTEEEEEEEEGNNS
jgi:hypothetical protein